MERASSALMASSTISARPVTPRLDSDTCL